MAVVVGRHCDVLPQKIDMDLYIYAETEQEIYCSLLAPNSFSASITYCCIINGNGRGIEYCCSFSSKRHNGKG